MEILLTVLLISAVTLALFYRSKAKEFESLFELSKSEYPVMHVDNVTGWPSEAMVRVIPAPKLNKDGSIAKKRGRKPRNGTF
jgi:hypothetical protein